MLCDSVISDPLKKVLSSGILDKMKQAIMFLVQKFASRDVDQERVGTSRLNQGKKISEEERGELVSRKWARGGAGLPQGLSSRQGTEGVCSGNINKTLMIVGTRGAIAPTVHERVNKEVVGVEIRPNERWIGGSTVPLRIFQLFNLHQDVSAYADHS